MLSLVSILKATYSKSFLANVNSLNNQVVLEVAVMGRRKPEISRSSIVQSLNSPFCPPHIAIGVEPGRAKRESLFAHPGSAPICLGRKESSGTGLGHPLPSFFPIFFLSPLLISYRFLNHLSFQSSTK